MIDYNKNKSDLRKRAEDIARKKQVQSPENINSPSSVKIQRTLHELRVHQIELEMQNEELRTAQLELEAARARYFDLYDLAPVGYFTVSEKGLILQSNFTAANLLGVARNAMVNLPISKFILKEDQDIYYLHHEKLFQTNKPQVCELRMLKKDGDKFWAQLESNVAKDDNGATVLHIMLSDITGRKRTEEVQDFLAQTSGSSRDEPFFNALARYLAQSLQMDLVCIDRLDGDGLTAHTLSVWCNGHFEDNVSYALKDTPCGNVVGKTVCCFPASVCQFFPRDQVLRDLRAESYVGVTLWSHAGQPIGLIAVIGHKPLVNRTLVEATLEMVAIRAAGELERKQAEEKINAIMNFQTALMDAIPSPVFYKDTGGVYIGGNKAFEQYIGLSPEQFIGKTVYDISPSDLAETYYRADMELLNSQGVQTYESSVVDAGGTQHTVVFNKAVFTDAAGKTAGLVGVILDITDRKEAEKILARDKKTLQKLVEERSDELIEFRVKLERSKRLADIGTLAATVAHELRNPLAGISVAATVIKRKNTDAIIEQQLERIDKMIGESGQIIDNLLFYSRLRPPQRRTFNIHALLEECTCTFQHAQIGESTVISNHIDSLEDVTISADPVQIRELFINILNNAADAIPDNGGEIDVKAMVYPEVVKIHVTDNGHGIAKEELGKVFEPFFTTKAKGTGLGLTVCLQIVKMHNGIIKIKSRKGKGTSVIITLPKGKTKGITN